MSFENIRIPDFLIAEFYKDCLVELGNTNLKHSDTSSNISNEGILKEYISSNQEIQYIGEHNQNISILVKDEKAVFLNDNNLNFLTNVLKACNLFIGDIAIINTSNQVLNFTKLTDNLSPRVVILFQVEPSEIDLPFSIPDFQPQIYAGVTYLKAPALDLINTSSAESRVLKTKLWANLQQIFNL